MKTIALSTLLLAVLALSAAAATEPPACITAKVPPGGVTNRVQLGADIWFTSGRGEWEETFHSDYFNINNSLLEWEDLSSRLLVLRGEVFITPWLSVDGSWAAGDIEDGENTDSDRNGSRVVIQSKADTEGETTMASAAVNYRFSRQLFRRWAGYSDVFLGYQYYRDELNDHNGVDTVLFGQPVDVPFEGLDSTYMFEWSAIRLGLRTGIPLFRRLSFTTSLSSLLIISYYGEGYWNLRDDFRRQSPNFVDKSDGGAGSELQLGLNFQVCRHFALEAGGRVIYLYTQDGVDKTYYADGTSDTTPIDHVESLRYGAYAGLRAGF
jgi:hypothetical protein